MRVIRKTVNTFRAAAVLFCVVQGAGCVDPGSRALLKGERFINEGKYEKAVVELQSATRLLPKNAQAWNHLGLAYHHQNEFLPARQAYAQALAIDINLAAARYNLGCLLLENNDLSGAIDQLTSYTLLQPRTMEGWLKLGTAQLRARRPDPAEKSFKTALEISPANVEALNGLGNVQFHRKRNQEALALFNRTLEQNPNYSPALLNAAIVTHQSLNNRPLALQLYRKYVAQRPPNADAVLAVANQLDKELNPPPPVQVATPPPPVVKSNPPAALRVAATPPAILTKPAPAPNPPPKAAETPPPKTSPPVEVTRVANDLTIRPVQDVSPASTAKTNTVAQTGSNDPRSVDDKRGLLARLNPFGAKAKTNSTEVTVAARSANPPTAIETPVPSFPKYKYISPAKPTAGNRKEAEKFLASGVKAQRSGNPRMALDNYQDAIQADPAYFEAYYNRGLATYELGIWAESLKAYEYALAIRPDSSDARYNFALALKNANHIDDAIQQLTQVVKAHPNETRAHLSLANLYAHRLNQPALARQHFAKVLENDPRHPQAAEIRFWLASHSL
jgi:tetratricopeptide (TPR) repeat protein